MQRSKTGQHPRASPGFVVARHLVELLALALAGGDSLLARALALIPAARVLASDQTRTFVRLISLQLHRARGGAVAKGQYSNQNVRGHT